MPKERGWAIAGNCGLYIGWWQRRTDAIAGHVASCYSGFQDYGEISQFARGRGLDEAQSRAWSAARKKGDRVVKVTLSYT